MSCATELAALSVLALLSSAACASGARAQISESARAEQLFNDGKARLAEHDYAQACPLLAESFRAEPATGALLALALCHERSGKLASAQREYGEVAVRSHQEQRADREQAARDRARELAASVSSVTIERGAAPKSLTVALDGTKVAEQRLGKAIAVDGGEHTIVASAPNQRTWTVQLQVGDKADAQHVVIPALAPVPAAPSSRIPILHARPIRDAASLSPEAWVGLGSLGAGVLTLGAATVLAVRAGDEPNAISGGCADGVCTYREPNHDTKNASTLCFVVGGILAASGAAIYLVSLPSRAGSDSASAEQHALALQGYVLPGEGGAALRGTF